jgi:sterol desaturase/sphingolipid hydroxylase (fatty acid hydroxylase superfamily)
MIGIPVALATFNAAEWLIHKHLLHGAGRNKKSIWAFHWHEHHGNARRNEMRDETYERTPFGMHAQGKELVALSAGALAALSVAPVVPFYSGTMLFCIGEYYYKHRKSHEDPEWARENLPWHYDHHMGPNQNSNWGVVRPWMDILMGTREPYVGTEREARDRKRRADRERKRSAGEAALAAA